MINVIINKPFFQFNIMVSVFEKALIEIERKKKGKEIVEKLKELEILEGHIEDYGALINGIYIDLEKTKELILLEWYRFLEKEKVNFSIKITETRIIINILGENNETLKEIEIYGEHALTENLIFTLFVRLPPNIKKEDFLRKLINYK